MQKNQRDEILIAVHDEARGLLRALGVDDPADFDLHGAGGRAHGHGIALVGLLIGHDAHGVTADPRIAAKHGAPKLLLVLVELAAVNDAGNDLAHVIDIAGAGRGIEEAVEVFGGKLRRILRGIEFAAAEDIRFWIALADLRHQRAQTRKTGLVVGLLEIDGAGNLSVHGCATQFFGAGLLADGRLYQRWTGEKQAGAFGHEHRIGHNRQICAAGHAHAHDGGDLGNAHGAHHRVVAENAAEVVDVGKDILLQRKKDAGGIDQVERGDAVFHGDGLRAQNFFGRHGKERAGLHGCVVGHDHAQAAADAAQGR